MKKSEMTVSMPLTSFNEYEEIRRSFEELKKEMSECFDSRPYLGAGCVDFDTKKALEICRKFIPYKYADYDIVISQ